LTADLQYALGGGVELESNGRLENNVISFNSIVHNATTGQAGSGGVDCYSSPSDRRQAVVICNKITRNSVFSKSNLVGTSAFAGGISYYGSYGRFADNEISYNELRANSDKSAGGAGILINEAPDSLIMDGNSIFKNEVKQGNGLGGGVLIGKNSSLTVTNNIIEGNSANVGGGFIIARSTVHLVNNTVINNQATDGGGGINVRMSSTVYLMNTILWGNQAATYAGIQREEGTVKAAYCDIQGGWSGEGNINADPLFTDDSYYLASSSPCVGAGIHAYDFGEGMICTCPSTDYNGDPRPYPVDAHVDMGAIESEYLIDDVQEKTEQIPTHFALEQNYPNPFNPSTTIEFTLPKSDFVTLTVYNLCGEQVTTLITERMEAGVHCFKWNGSSLANGMYLYRLEAGEFSQSKKLVLLR